MARAAHAINRAIRRARTCPDCRGTGYLLVDLHHVRCQACDGHGTALPLAVQQHIAHLEAVTEQQRQRIAELDAEAGHTMRHIGVLHARLAERSIENADLRQELARARRDTLREAVDLDLAYQQARVEGGGRG